MTHYVTKVTECSFAFRIKKITPKFSKTTTKNTLPLFFKLTTPHHYLIKAITTQKINFTITHFKKPLFTLSKANFKPSQFAKKPQY